MRVRLQSLHIRTVPILDEGLQERVNVDPKLEAKENKKQNGKEKSRKTSSSSTTTKTTFEAQKPAAVGCVTALEFSSNFAGLEIRLNSFSSSWGDCHFYLYKTSDGHLLI